MHIMHIALGGCLRAPPIDYGISEDTGGHIAYVLGAAIAQARHPGIRRVDVVTRAFEGRGDAYQRLEEALAPRAFIRRLRTVNRDYLAKDALWAEVSALADALIAALENGPRPDVLHAHFSDAAEIAFSAGAAFGIPVVYTPHSLALDKSGSAEGRRIAAERRAIGLAGAIVVSSRDEAERQVIAYDADAITRVHRIAPGVPLETAAPTDLGPLLSGLKDADRPMVLAVARPVAKKNLIALTRAFVASARLRDRANLVILAGQHERIEPGPRAVLDELREAGAGCLGRFVLPPAHDTAQVAALYRRAAATRGVFVNPALFEPFGLTLLEAAQAGLPVVATRHGGPSAILDDLKNGILVDPLDTDAIAAACLSLLDDPARWDAASANGKAGIGNYSWHRYAAETIAVYRDVCAAPKSPMLQSPHILVCDIDNTLTGCRTAARAFGDWTLTAPHPFVVATGRSLPEARAVLRQWDVPEPAAFITSVGTEVFLREGGTLKLWSEFSERIGATWSRAQVKAVLDASGIAWQPAVDQKAHKLSLFGSIDAARLIRRRLQAAGLAALVIHSHGRLIDVLPPAAGKANAVAALAARHGLGMEHCIAAGDSGNDIDMLRLCGRAIVVGNASAELAGLPARDGLLRTQAHFAGGVMEGLGRMGLAP